MTIEVSSYPPSHAQETDHESWHFQRIERLQENADVDRGEEFFMELQLLPATNYFGLEKAIAVVDVIHPVSVLPAELTKDLWPLVTYLYEKNEELEVSGRLWTSPEYREFYASVRIDLPPIDEIQDTVRYELVLEDDFEFPDNPYFVNNIVDYTSEEWRKAHGMTDEEAQAHVDATARRVREFRSESSAGDKTYPLEVQKPDTSQDVISKLDWVNLLTPDGTPRANLFQRGYVRATVREHSSSGKAPRIDYATVGQCKRILEEFGEPTSEVDKRNGLVLKGLWWILLILLAIVGLIGLFTPPVGWVFLAIVLSPFFYHYWTRLGLKPPFGKQQ